MVGSWLLKIIIGLGLAGVIAFEAGSPIVARLQADDAATQIADQTAFRLRSEFKQATLDESCAEEGDMRQVTVVRCEFDNATSEVVITAQKVAPSLLLGRLSATADWYRPQVTARSALK